MTPTILPRGLRPRLERLLKKHPIVVLEGARAVGKTTLATSLLNDNVLPGRLIALDEEFELASSDPKNWLTSLPFGSVIDEAQLLPAILPAIKRLVDQDPSPGRFLLTGSSRLRQDSLGGSDPLAGRAVRVTLGPLTISERVSKPFSVITHLASGDPTSWDPPPLDRATLLNYIASSGLPGTLDLDPLQQEERLTSYPDRALGSEIVQRRRHSIALRVLRHALANSPLPENIADLSRKLTLNRETLLSHIDLLEESFLLWRLPGFASEGGSGELRRSKLVAFDTGLASRLPRNDETFGGMAETFVLNELVMQASWLDAAESPTISHWRYKDRAEVDIVLRMPNNNLIAIEVKLSSTASPSHTKWLAAFRDRYQRPGRSISTFVIHPGDRVIQNNNHTFLPMGALLAC